MSQIPSLLPLYSEHLRPMKMGQIFDRVFQLMRTNFRLFVGIATLPAAGFILTIAVMIIPIMAQLPRQPDPEKMFYFMIPAGLITLVINLAAFAIYLPAACYAAMQADAGIKVSLREAYRKGWERAGHYMGLLVVSYLIAFLPVLVVELVFGAGIWATLGGKSTPATWTFVLIPIGMLLILGAFVYGIIVAMRISLALPASIAEGLTVRAALKRSGQLTRGAKGRIFGVLLVIYAASYAAFFALEIACMIVIVVGILAGSAMHLQVSPPWSIVGIVVLAVFGSGVMFLWMAMMYAAYSAAFAVLYHDQRLRQDGPWVVPKQSGELA